MEANGEQPLAATQKLSLPGNLFKCVYDVGSVHVVGSVYGMGTVWYCLRSEVLFLDVRWELIPEL